MSLLLALVLAADAPAATANAAAAPPPPAATAKSNSFAQPNDIVFTSGTSLRFTASAPMLASRPAAVPTASGARDEFSGEATLALAIDYFVVKRVSVGAFVRAGYSWSPDAYGPGFGVGPRIGYQVPFTEWVSIWPRLDMSFGAQATFVRATASASAPPPGTLWFFNAALHLPLVFSILQHVVIGVGPYFALEPQWMAGQSEVSAFALNFGVSSFIGWHY